MRAPRDLGAHRLPVFVVGVVRGESCASGRSVETGRAGVRRVDVIGSQGQPVDDVATAEPKQTVEELCETSTCPGSIATSARHVWRGRIEIGMTSGRFIGVFPRRTGTESTPRRHGLAALGRLAR